VTGSFTFQIVVSPSAYALHGSGEPFASETILPFSGMR